MSDDDQKEEKQFWNRTVTIVEKPEAKQVESVFKIDPFKDNHNFALISVEFDNAKIIIYSTFRFQNDAKKIVQTVRDKIPKTFYLNLFVVNTKKTLQLKDFNIKELILNNE